MSGLSFPQSTTPKQAWQQRYWGNIISGYARWAVRLICGLIQFPLLWQYFDETTFGFWSILWSLVMYGILFDFGLGRVAQRAAGQFLANRQQQPFLTILSTIFWPFCLITASLPITAWALRDVILAPYIKDPLLFADFASAFVAFFCSMAALLIAGLLSEILRGIHYITLVNILHTIISVSSLVGLWLGIHAEWSIADCMWFICLLQCLLAIIILMTLYRTIPGFSLHPRRVSWGTLRSQLRFGGYNYGISVTNVVLASLDIILAAHLLGLAIIPIIRAATIVADLLNQSGMQLVSPIPSAVSQLQAERKTAEIKTLIWKNTLLHLGIMVPLCLLAMIYAPGIIAVLTGDSTIDAITWHIAQLLLIAILIERISAPAREAFVFIGYERFVLFLNIGRLIIHVSAAFMAYIHFGPMAIAHAHLAASAVTLVIPVLWALQRSIPSFFSPPPGLPWLRLGGTLVLCAIITLGCAALWPMTTDITLIELCLRGAIGISPLFISVRGLMRNLGS
jgi:O-antigen/teichoic acid export membrane protein